MGGRVNYKRSAVSRNDGEQYRGAGFSRRGDTNYRRGAAHRAGVAGVRLCKAEDMEVRKKMTIANKVYNICSDCAPLSALFECSAPKSSVSVYFDIIRDLTEMEKRGIIELYAGDCPIGKAAEVVESELLYTVYHYLCCKKCRTIYKLGVCIRSTRLVAEKIGHKKEDCMEMLLKGRYGVYFEGMKDNAENTSF